MNDKIKYITVRLKESVVIPCVAYANPKPIYRYVQFLFYFTHTHAATNIHSRKEKYVEKFSTNSNVNTHYK